MKTRYYIIELAVFINLNILSQDNHLEEQFKNYTDSLFKAGELNFLANDLEEAKKMFIGYLVFVPGDLQSLEYLSQIAIAQQDLPSIKLYNEKILSLDPDNIDALIILGVIYFNERIYSKAEILFIKAINLAPNNELALYNLGVLYGTKGEFRKAEITLNKAAQINPLNGEVLQTLGLFNLQSQLYDGAEKYLLKAISIDHNLIDAKKGLIILYQNQARLEESAKYINDILRVSPDCPQLNLLIANQKFLIGETDSAITYALKEIKEEPDQFDAYYFLSTLYSLSGEEIKSQKAFAIAEKLLNNKIIDSPNEIILKRKSLINSIPK